MHRDGTVERSLQDAGRGRVALPVNGGDVP